MSRISNVITHRSRFWGSSVAKDLARGTPKTPRTPSPYLACLVGCLVVGPSMAKVSWPVFQAHGGFVRPTFSLIFNARACWLLDWGLYSIRSGHLLQRVVAFLAPNSPMRSQQNIIPCRPSSHLTPGFRTLMPVMGQSLLST